MNCDTCGAAGTGTEKFCRQCGSPMTALPATEPPTVVDGDCRECGVALRPGAQFCAACGTAQVANPSRDDGHGASVDGATATAETLNTVFGGPPPTAPHQPPIPAAPLPPAPPPRPAAAPAPAAASKAGSQFMLPHLPCKWLWNPRKPWRVTTVLSEREVADLFEARMTKKPNVVLRANSYFRRARWVVDRNAISGQIVATCDPTGLVSVGFGKSKQHVDISGNTVILDVEREERDDRTSASVAPGMFTTWFGLYMFPATIYPFDVVKTIKRGDRAAKVEYPWSILRIGVATLVAIAILAAVVSGGGGADSTTANVAPPAPELAPAPTPTLEPTTTDTTTTGTTTTETTPTGPPTLADAGFAAADGYTVEPPKGWINNSDSKDKGTFTESRWHKPGNPGVYVIVNHTAGYAGTAEDGARTVRASAQQAASYVEHDFRADGDTGWYWEFELGGARKIDVFSTACGDGYAALGAAPVADFEAERAAIESFTQSLTPPCKRDAGPTTTPPTTTAPPDESPPAAVKPASGSAPTQVLRRHFESITSGDVDTAFRLLSSGYRARNPRWADEPRAAQPYIHIAEIGPSSIHGRRAGVPITFYGRDRNDTESSDTKCRRFVGRARLIKEGPFWRYDPPRNAYDVTIIDSALSVCNP